MNAAARAAMTTMVNTMDAGQQLGRVNRTRSFGVYGPPGTGKNELAAQLAASMISVDADGNERQGMPLYQTEFGKDMDIEALIGTTVMTPDGTRAQLGGLGLAAAQGAVICLNEVVRNPKMLTEIQPMLEEGVIRLRSTEAGMITIPVHPSTVFILTWNPGMEGDADRPAGAALARIKSFELPRPTVAELADRTKAFFRSAPDALKPSDAEVRASTILIDTIAKGIERGDMQRRGRGSRVPPGPRELEQFVLTGKTDGWNTALETLKIYCDQNPEDKETDWNFVREQFEMHFGADGNALNRTAPASR
jgi:MoxR-like ATPase